MFANINELLYIEAKLYPKIIKISRLQRRHKKIVIDLLYDKASLGVAKKMAEFLKKNGVVVLMDEIPNISKADAYILVTKHISKKFKQKLLKTKKLIFSIYPEMIKDSMISIYIGVKVKPIINPYLIKKASISLNPIILKVAKIYEED
jgi:hypothetical protein